MSAKHTPGPWIANSKDCRVYGNDGSPIADALQWSHPIQQTYNLYLIAAAPALLEDAKSTDQGYDWFRDELLAFRNYFGAQTVKQTEAFIDSLIAHLDSRQIGTRRAIACAEGSQS